VSVSVDGGSSDESTVVAVGSVVDGGVLDRGGVLLDHGSVGKGDIVQSSRVNGNDSGGTSSCSILNEVVVVVVERNTLSVEGSSENDVNNASSDNANSQNHE